MTPAMLLQTALVSCVPLLLAGIGGLLWRWVTKDRRREAVETRRTEARTRQIEADVSAQLRDSLAKQVESLIADREAMGRQVAGFRQEVIAHEASLAQCRQETLTQKAELAMQATAIGSSVAKIAMLQGELAALKEHLAGCPVVAKESREGGGR